MGFQFRAMNLVNEHLTTRARIASMRAAQAFGLVDLEFGITCDEGVESHLGSAVVALRDRAGAPVPHPFIAPASFRATSHRRTP